MTEHQADEYSRSLGQIVGGTWRQIKLAQQMGVPKILRLSIDDWVRLYLGGYARLTVADRRDAVHEMSEEGMSQREIAGVLGVAKTTVDRDLASGPNGPESSHIGSESGPNGPILKPAKKRKSAEDSPQKPQPVKVVDPEVVSQENLPSIDVAAPETTHIANVVSKHDKKSTLVIQQPRFENLIRGVIRPLIQKICQQAGPKHAVTMRGAMLQVLGELIRDIQREEA